MDVLAAIFFAVAATWLLFALMYASLVLLFLRIRARGDLDRIFEADFGRVYICGSTRYYISFGWMLRRYVRHIHPHPLFSDGGPSHLMTRKERRDAMEALLTSTGTETLTITIRENGEETTNGVHAAPESSSQGEFCPAKLDHPDEEMQDDCNDSTERPACSICLGDYEPSDILLGARSCPHKFHKDCILDWLQRQHQSECPCCRVRMVDEEDVWRVVRSKREEAKQQNPPKNLTSSSSSTSSSSDEPSEEVGCPQESVTEADLEASSNPLSGVPASAKQSQRLDSS